MLNLISKTRLSASSNLPTERAARKPGYSPLMRYVLMVASFCVLSIVTPTLLADDNDSQTPLSFKQREH
ncbi:MAG: hypothetical protein AB8B63_20585, partial [Granulosicoccus sp.]